MAACCRRRYNIPRTEASRRPARRTPWGSMARASAWRSFGSPGHSNLKNNMQIAFHGAARTVTGSKHLLTLDNGHKVLLDCGMFQGMGREGDELNRSFGFDAREVTHLILSHAHIDHSGLVPKLVAEGFNGKIYATSGTRDLCAVLLQDSAEIQR